MIACDDLKIVELRVENCSAASEVTIVYIDKNAVYNRSEATYTDKNAVYSRSEGIYTDKIAIYILAKANFKYERVITGLII